MLEDPSIGPLEEIEYENGFPAARLTADNCRVRVLGEEVRKQVRRRVALALREGVACGAVSKVRRQIYHLQC